VKEFLEKIIDGFLNIIPNQDWFFPVYLFLFLFLSVILIIILSKKAGKKNLSKDNRKKEITINDLLKIASNPKSKNADLLGALILYKDNFKMENDEKKSIEFFEKLLNHKNRNKAIFDYFHGNILPDNLKYKDKLDEIERKALNK